MALNSLPLAQKTPSVRGLVAEETTNSGPIMAPHSKNRPRANYLDTIKSSGSLAEKDLLPRLVQVISSLFGKTKLPEGKS